MTVYHANAIFRNAKGREVSYRVPLWSGEAADIAGAMAAARNAAKASDAMTADVDTVVIKLKGPKDSLVTATEYAEDLRSGEGSSADQTTLLNDKACDLSPEEMESMRENLKREAMDLLEKKFDGTTERLIKPFVEKQSFDATGTTWDPASGKDFTIRQVFIDGKEVSIVDGYNTYISGGPIVWDGKWAREDMDSAPQWPSPSDRAVWSEKDDLSLSITDRVSGAIREVQNKTGTHPTKIVMGTKAWERFSKEQNITPCNGPFSVELLGLPITVDDRVGDFLVGVKQQPSK